MPKAKHRKRVRAARQSAASAPIGGEVTQDGAREEAAAPKKVGKKEADVEAILAKLRSADAKERAQSSSVLSSMLLSLPPVTLRLVLAKNLIGLLIERLTDAEDEVVVEALGALRNLAVSSPLSLLSEMHNKRVLLPLQSKIIPTLMSFFPSAIQAGSAQNGATQAERKAAEDRRRLYWNWSENVLTLIWCLAESNTKILASLNAQPAVLQFCTLFLSEHALGFTSQAAKGKKKEKSKAARVPLYVAVTAAQAVLALISSNPVAQKEISTETVASLQAVLSASSAAGAPVKTDSRHATESSDTDDWLTLRIVSFGTLLELSKEHKRFKHLKDELKPHASILLGAAKFDLDACVSELEELAQSESDVERPSSNKLVGYERRLSTLQIALEVLSENLASLDSLSSSDLDDEEEEEWHGIMDEDGDAEMMSDDEEVILQRERPGEDDLDGVMEDGAPALSLQTDELDRLAALPTSLLSLAKPTKLSFLPAQTTVVSKTTLLPTSASETQAIVPASILPLAETITVIHVRALECANNLFITLAKSLAVDDDVESIWRKDWQAAFENVLELVRGAAATVTSDVGPERDGTDRKDEMSEDEERKLEFVMAGCGVVWGLARLGLNGPADTPDRLTVVPAVSSFLLELFSHPFARLLTPAGESIRVRTLGALGCLARRRGVTAEENAAVGDALLSILPQDKQPSPLAPTTEVLIQAIDSLIDLYADEESAYDNDVFVKRAYLARLESAVPGVRAACKKIDKKRFPALRHRADGALENLVAFTQYRRQLVP